MKYYVFPTNCTLGAIQITRDTFLADFRPPHSPCDIWWYCHVHPLPKWRTWHFSFHHKYILFKAFEVKSHLKWPKNVTWHFHWPARVPVSFSDTVPTPLSVTCYLNGFFRLFDIAIFSIHETIHFCKRGLITLFTAHYLNFLGSFCEIKFGSIPK